MVSIIAAMAEGNRAIGLQGDLPWRLPADMARFRELTMGNPVIMGRITWDPIAERGLPGRFVIVVTRSGSAKASAQAAVTSLGEALEVAAKAEYGDEIFIAGGAQIYKEALRLNLVDRMYLTIVHAQLEGDTFFPEYEQSEWKTVLKEERQVDERNPYGMTFCLLERIRV